MIRFVEHLECPTCISATRITSGYDYQLLCHDVKGVQLKVKIKMILGDTSKLLQLNVKGGGIWAII